MSGQTFVVKKEIKLAFLGEGWEEAYVSFKPFSFNDNDKILDLYKLAKEQANMSQDEAKKASDNILSLLRDKFIDGKGFDGTKLVAITKDNLGELPMEIIVHILQTLQGQSLLPPKG